MLTQGARSAAYQVSAPQLYARCLSWKHRPSVQSRTPLPAWGKQGFHLVSQKSDMKEEDLDFPLVSLPRSCRRRKVPVVSGSLPGEQRQRSWRRAPHRACFAFASKN